MKALVYTGPEQLELRDVADPVAGPHERLIRIEASGICGSDMHAYLGHDERRPAPMVLGHEAAGTVVQGPEAGRRVTINPLNSCGTCRACASGRNNLCPDRQIISLPPRAGAFAQMVAIPEAALITVPDHISMAQAALAEPLACGWHAVRLAAEAMRGLTGRAALVLGGGPIGLGAALSLRAMDCADITIVEPNPRRRDRLREIDSFAVVAEAKGVPDVVVDAVGFAATRAVASALVAPGGVIAHIGLGEATGGLDIRRMTLQEITFIGTYTYTPADFRATAEAMFDGRLGALDWTESRHLADGAAAFAALLAGEVAAPKIILAPN